MSGTGKSTVIRELAARGYKAIDTDDNEGFIEVVTVPEDQPAGLRGQDQVWREDRMEELLSEEDSPVLFVSGTAPNQWKFYPQFDHIVLLSAPASLIAERLATRTTNPYGKDPDEVARTLQLQETVEPALRRVAGLEVDTSMPLDEVVTVILQAVQPRADKP